MLKKLVDSYFCLFAKVFWILEASDWLLSWDSQPIRSLQISSWAKKGENMIQQVLWKYLDFSIAFAEYLSKLSYKLSIMQSLKESRLNCLKGSLISIFSLENSINSSVEINAVICQNIGDFFACLYIEWFSFTYLFHYQGRLP